jgi:putative ABC transport system permease protein
MARLGDCVLGARVAAARGTGPGGHVVSSPESAFDLAGVYPLRMRVAGVLAPAGTSDDHAIFVDVRTAWVIEGLAHGHDDLAEGEVLGRGEGNTVANASVVQHREVTPENEASFHFHGDEATFPITAVLAVPPDRKSLTLLRGRYESPEETRQIVEPLAVIDGLLGTVLAVEGLVVAALALAGAATLATAALVFLLSARLRAREIATMRKIGGSRGAIAAVLGAEVVLVLLAGAVLAGVLTGLVAWLGPDAVRRWTG